jgi:hypothetical protein
MEKEDVNINDMMDELLDYIDVEPEPLTEDGWFRCVELHAARDTTSLDMIYDRVRKAYLEGKLDRRKWGRFYYYKKI